MPHRELQLSMAPSERPDEYVPWGRLRFDEPSLAVSGDGMLFVASTGALS